MIVAGFNHARRGPVLSVEEVRIPLPFGHISDPVIGDGGVLIVGSGTITIDAPSVRAWLAQGPSEMEMIDLARQLVRQQEEREPAKVGGPTDVLVLDVTGGRWVAQKPICQ